MGLHVGVLCSKKSLGFLRCHRLHVINVLAAAVIAVVGIAFRILVRQQVAHGSLGVQGAVVLAGDELQVGTLGLQLLHDGGGDFRPGGGHLLQVGYVGNHGGIGLLIFGACQIIL